MSTGYLIPVLCCKQAADSLVSVTQPPVTRTQDEVAVIPGRRGRWRLSAPILRGQPPLPRKCLEFAAFWMLDLGTGNAGLKSGKWEIWCTVGHAGEGCGGIEEDAFRK